MKRQSLLLLFFAALTSGCIKQVKTPRKQVVKMGPMVFYARGGKVVRIEHLTPKQLFFRGGKAYQKAQYKKAYAYYHRLLKYHKATTYYEPALYNQGLTLEKLKQFEAAAALYQRVLDSSKDFDIQKDARFRLAASWLGAKKWKKAERILRHLRSIHRKLTVSERLEARARLGIALHEQGRIVEAKQMFHSTISYYRRASRKEYLGNDYYASLAQFRLGLIHDRRFRKRKFRLKKSQMAKDLTAKATDLLAAQAHYIRTIRLRNPDWVVAALFRIGDMYRQMFDDMMNAPVPKDLTPAQLRLYRNILKKRIRVLLTKANYAFERNIQAAQSLGLQSSAWIAKTRKRIKELREKIVKLYYSEPTSAPASKPTSAPAQKAPPRPTPPARPQPSKPTPRPAPTR